MEGWRNHCTESGEQAQRASRLVMMDPSSSPAPGGWPWSLSGPLKGEGKSRVWKSLGTHHKSALPLPSVQKHSGNTPSFCGQGSHTSKFTVRLP